MTQTAQPKDRIELERVAFSYGDQVIFDELDLRVGAGEAVGLLGGNGAGKSTLLKLLAGLLHPSHGDLRIAGVSVLTDRVTARRKMGFVPDDPPLYTAMSAEENLNMFGVLWEVPAARLAKRAKELIAAVGLEPHKRLWVRAYSRGMRQRLALCAALIHQPEVLLLDEAFTGLDASSSEACRQFLLDFVAQGGAILAATHEPNHRALALTRLVELENGRVRPSATVSLAANAAGAGRP